MEKRFTLDHDGQAVYQTDINTLGDVAGQADDVVFAELFRMTPYNGSVATKGILPTGTSALIAANGATGSVLVNPFRGFVSSRTAVATEARDNWRDIRSGLSVAEGATALATTVNLAANVTAFARWDVIYATIAVDASSSPVTRLVKDPGTSAVTSESVSVFRQTNVTVSVTAGTPALPPLIPTIPSDSAGNYYVAIGYVRVPAGFTAGSTVAPVDIAVTAPVLAISPTTGAASARVANSHFATTLIDGTVSGRVNAFIPPTVGGMESLYVFLDLRDASTANHSHVTTGLIDDSRDWRNRFCFWMAGVYEYGLDPCWSTSTTSTDATIAPNGTGIDTQSIAANTIVSGVGQTMIADFNATIAGARKVAFIDAGVSSQSLLEDVTIYCDSTGALRLYMPANARTAVVLRLDFSGPLDNRA